MSSDEESYAPQYGESKPIRKEIRVSGNDVVMWEQYSKYQHSASSYQGWSIGHMFKTSLLMPHNLMMYNLYSFVGTSYRKLLEVVPSELEDFMPQNNDPIEAHDFVDYVFSIEVYPMIISVMERYEPGTVIRIWAWDKSTKYWQKLWSGPPQCCRDYKIESNSRVFTPPLALCQFTTCWIRLELNHSLANYYTQLDGVLLIGTEQLIVPNDGMINVIPRPVSFGKNMKQKKSNSQTDLSMPYHENDTYNRTPYAQGCQRFNDDLDNFRDFVSRNYSFRDSIDEERSQDSSRDNDEIANGSFNRFNELPYEIVVKILEYLDLKTLVRCSQVDKLFNTITRDFKLYRSLNLKPYWNCVDPTTLLYLQERCTHLKRIDLSWSCCTKISSEVFIDFLRNCGGELTHLRLNNCGFVEDDVIVAISIHCPHLKEFCYNGCTGFRNGNFEPLAKLKCLERLEFYDSNSFVREWMAIIRNNVKLRHLNLGKSSRSLGRSSPDEIDESYISLETLNYELENMDLVVKCLSHCENLRELNIAYCAGTERDYAQLAQVFRDCHNLEKVFASCANLNNSILESLLHCRKMKVLDISECKVSLSLVDRMFAAWPDLKFIDLSECFRHNKKHVKHRMQRWNKHYPNVSIVYNRFQSYMQY